MINVFPGVIITHVKTQTAIVLVNYLWSNNEKTRLVFKVKAPTANVKLIFGGRFRGQQWLI
ncbi:MAG: hypothetical protein IKP88_13235 [Lachnospiraceae bacterium]|nr:hypothetical protein [Lachnospiraceae bacterium]